MAWIILEHLISTMTSELGVQVSHFDFLENVPNIILLMVRGHMKEKKIT
jgi:hypothetical protein